MRPAKGLILGVTFLAAILGFQNCAGIGGADSNVGSSTNSKSIYFESFEGENSIDNLSYGWGTGAPEISTEASVNGQYGLKLYKIAFQLYTPGLKGGYNSQKELPLLNVNKRYRISYWARADVETTTNPILVISTGTIDAFGKSNTSIIQALEIVSDQWSHYEYILEPKGPELLLEFFLNTESENVAYIDDLSIEEL